MTMQDLRWMSILFYHISCLKLIIRLIEVLFCDNIIGVFLS